MKQKKTPNILLIVTDQQHADTIRAAGCPHVDTPGQDKLYQEGVSFSQNYCTYPLCSPSRASIFTGRYPLEVGVPANGGAIRNDIPTIGQWLNAKSNYQCYYSGKWHIPLPYSYDIPGFHVLSDGMSHQAAFEDTTRTLACDMFLRNYDSEDPFLLVAAYLQPHDICQWIKVNQAHSDPIPFYEDIADELPPLPDNFDVDPTEPASVSTGRLRLDSSTHNWTEEQWRYYRWSYYRMIEQIDGEVLGLLNTLEETGHDRDTLVIFTSDHGEGLGHHRYILKQCLYDESVRVPLIVRLPGQVQANVQTDRIASGNDLFPTICDYAGVEPPEHLRGQSLRPVLEGKPIGHWQDYVASVQDTGSSKPGFGASRMIRSHDFKYIVFKDDPVEQLFDMANDPGETKNLAADPNYSEQLKQHRDYLAHLETSMDYAPTLPLSTHWPSTTDEFEQNQQRYSNRFPFFNEANNRWKESHCLDIKKANWTKPWLFSRDWQAHPIPQDELYFNVEPQAQGLELSSHNIFRMVLNEKAPDNSRMRCVFTWLEGEEGGLHALLRTKSEQGRHPRSGQNSGYAFQLSGHGNTRAALLRHGQVVSEMAWQLEQGVRYTLDALLVNQEFGVYVILLLNGKNLLTWVDRTPIPTDCFVGGVYASGNSRYHLEALTFYTM